MTIEVRKYLNEVKTVLAPVVPDGEIILFGSQARGDAHDDSDIDLLILVNRDELTFDDKTKIFEAVYDIELKYMIDFQLIIRTRKQWFAPPFRTPFFINVMNEGILL